MLEMKYKRQAKQVTSQCHLLLVKHSQPQIIPDIPAREWHLSEEGRQRCYILARNLTPYAPSIIVSSIEPKAIETAAIVGQELSTPYTVAPGLHEHDRSNTGYATQESFEQAIANFFASPNKLVFGQETAHQARERFTQAVFDVLAQHDKGNIVIVAHGTVITLFVAQFNAIDPFAFWKQLALPSFVVLEIPGFRLIR